MFEMEFPGGPGCSVPCSHGDDRAPQPENRASKQNEQGQGQNGYRAYARPDMSSGSISVAGPEFEADGHEGDGDKQNDHPADRRCDDVSEKADEKGVEKDKWNREQGHGGEQGEAAHAHGIDGAEKKGAV